MGRLPATEAPLLPAMSSQSNHRSGYAAIVGRPNVGKSTLLNALVGQKLSITSRKAQTTRHRIAGIVHRPGAQFVFVDTPGFQTERTGTLNRLMNRTVTDALRGVDVILFVVEANHYDERDARVLKLFPRELPVILVINKVDRVADKRRLLPFIAKLGSEFAFTAVVPVSAQRGSQLGELLGEILLRLPESPPQFDADQMTDRDERFFAAEFLREKLFRMLGEELPYSTSVIVESFAQQGKLRRVAASILVDKAAHKPIVIGESGARLKLIATQARKDMEQLFGGKVFLEVWVKVRHGWSDNAGVLRQLGYG